jgi:hypothetical protein
VIGVRGCATLNVDEFEDSKNGVPVWQLVHWGMAAQRSAEPVSRMRFSGCGGVPMFTTPEYVESDSYTDSQRKQHSTSEEKIEAYMVNHWVISLVLAFPLASRGPKAILSAQVVRSPCIVVQASLVKNSPVEWNVKRLRRWRACCRQYRRECEEESGEHWMQSVGAKECLCVVTCNHVIRGNKPDLALMAASMKRSAAGSSSPPIPQVYKKIKQTDDEQHKDGAGDDQWTVVERRKSKSKTKRTFTRNDVSAASIQRALISLVALHCSLTLART